MTDRPRVLVIGGGVVGLCSAYSLAKAGHSVAVLDRGHREGPNCSTGNAGLICPSHFIPLAAPGMIQKGLRWMFQPESPFALRPSLSPALAAWGWRFWRASQPDRVRAAAPVLRDLNLLSRRLFVEFAREAGEAGFHQQGLLTLCRTEEAWRHEHEVAHQARDLGLKPEILDAEGVRRLNPGARVDVRGGVFFPEDCHIDPAAFRLQLIDQIERLGGVFHWRTSARKIERSGNRVTKVVADAGEFAPDEVVIAAGVWTKALAEFVGLRLPMQPGKGYSATLENPRVLPSVPAILLEARVAVTPLGNRLRVGGTMEIGAREGRINHRKVAGMGKALSLYFPDFQGLAFPRETWEGLRPCSPDGLPYIGRPRQMANVIVAAGHAMLGLSLAPATGRLVREMIDGDQPSVCPCLVDPNRFG